MKIDTFYNILKSNSNALASVEKMCDEWQDAMAKKILHVERTKTAIKSEFNQLMHNSNSEWQYCPVEQLI